MHVEIKRICVPTDFSMTAGHALRYGLTLADVWQRLTVVRAVRCGHPVDQICRYAQKTQIDLLVLGSHGRTSLSHFLLGSVAERVVRAAPCPVLVARERQREFVAYD